MSRMVHQTNGQDKPEITASTTDSSEITDLIEARIKQQRQRLGYEDRTFPAFGYVAYPSEAEVDPANWHLYHHLRLVNTNFDQFETILIRNPSLLDKIPVVNFVWKQIRDHAHSMANVYVKRALRDQTRINRHFVNVLNQLTMTVQTQHETITALQQQVAELQQSSPEDVL